jgi:rfaE bifunctional protein kinase chain/domain
MDSSELLGILDRVAQTKILVVGDVMLDRYWWGSASRLSPEAPVPVVALKKVSNVPGGAANVAANIAALGTGVVLVGLIGTDESANALRESMLERGISHEFLIESSTRPTTTKTRVLVHKQQIARIDDETDAALSYAESASLSERVQGLIGDVDAVVLSDYAKGCLSEGLLASIIASARSHEKIVLVDPKSRDFSKYAGATLITPNLGEALNAAAIENGGEAMADEAADRILSRTSIDSLLITLGEHGMKLFEKGKNSVHFPSMARQVFDVTGAGDTVVALLSAALGAKSGLHAAVTFANIGAGIAVEKPGTTVVAIDELRTAISNLKTGR